MSIPNILTEFRDVDDKGWLTLLYTRRRSNLCSHFDLDWSLVPRVWSA
jgi:hypothetical protein